MVATNAAMISAAALPKFLTAKLARLGHAPGPGRGKTSRRGWQADVARRFLKTSNLSFVKVRAQAAGCERFSRSSGTYVPVREFALPVFVAELPLGSTRGLCRVQRLLQG